MRTAFASLAALILACTGAASPPKSTCSGDFGTELVFADSPKAAAEQAKKEQKLVFVLHVSGHFEDPRFT